MLHNNDSFRPFLLFSKLGRFWELHIFWFKTHPTGKPLHTLCITSLSLAINGSQISWIGILQVWLSKRHTESFLSVF